MNQSFMIFGATCTIILLTLLISMTGKHELWKRWLMIALYATLLPCTYWAITGLLSQPLPASWLYYMWMDKSETSAEVIAGYGVQDEAIYLWVMLPGSDKPRYLSFPWDEKMMEGLEKSQQKAISLGGDGKVEMDSKMLYERSYAPNDETFYPPPQLATPPKTLEPTNVIEFQPAEPTVAPLPEQLSP